MDKKEDEIILTAGSDSKKQEKSFKIDHAERLLRLENNGGWTISPDSPYQFNAKDGITRKVQGQNKDTAKGISDKKSD